MRGRDAERERGERKRVCVLGGGGSKQTEEERVSRRMGYLLTCRLE